MPTAFITGINGQDGAYLAHLLLSKNYRVVGGVRDVNIHNAGGEIEYSKPREYANLRALNLLEDVELLPFDLTDETSMRSALEACAPDEIYNLAAQSSVAQAWQNPVETGETNGLGAVRLFCAANEICPGARLFHASSSEIFGDAVGDGEFLVDESTPFSPLNPYGIAKTYAHQMAVRLRETLGLKISCGILFNHESPLRPESFVSRKITQSVARIKRGQQSSLSLGNLDVVRDWGCAEDFARAMWLMLQTEPDDFVLATGTPCSLRDFVDEAFRSVELDADDYVRIDPVFFRPNEAAPLIGDIGKSSTRLGWTPAVSMEKLVQLMVEADLHRVDGTTQNIPYFADQIKGNIS